jgi:hypothetical protein
LSVAIVGHGVSGADVLERRRAEVARSLEGLRQLEPSFAEPGIDLDRVRVLDDGELVLMIRDVRIAALKMLLLLHGWIRARGCHEREDHRNDEGPALRGTPKRMC